MRPFSALAALWIAGSIAMAAGNVRVLILSGRNNHDWRTTTPQLRKLLNDTGHFDVRVNEEPAGMTEQTLAPYDAVVLDYDGTRWGATAEKALEQFVRSGKGLVAVHAASYSFSGLEVLGDNHIRTGIHEPAWPAYIEMIGGTWSEDAPKTGHAPRHIFDVRFTDKDHPVTQGLGDKFTVSDELYHNVRMQPGVHVLATAFDDPAMGGTGKAEPALWTVNYGKGRVFHTILGHDVAAMLATGFVQTFTRGVWWAARGDTLPSDAPRVQTPLRVLLVTGGHDHETSFYSVLDGLPGVKVNVDPHPAAFRKDLRQSYDVLVLYDMVSDLGETERGHLKEFVESGKGVVVLHHALADFSDTWPWWYTDVVGGRYLNKGSSYLHDQQLQVTPVGTHPILRGVPPMLIEDETYKDMWISPKVQVLLRTDHPTSDGPVAWVSPYAKSRVVVVQLGHGRAAHLHPGYRTLVRNSILWTGGRLE